MIKRELTQNTKPHGWFRAMKMYKKKTEQRLINYEIRNYKILTPNRNVLNFDNNKNNSIDFFFFF